MIEDVADLLGKQARVDRVHHGAAPRHRVVQLEVPEAVPRQRRDAIAHCHAQPAQRLRELARAQFGVRVRVAMNAAFDGARNDFGVAVIARRVRQQRRNQQRLVHDQAKHRGVPPVDCSGHRQAASRLCAGFCSHMGVAAIADGKMPETARASRTGVQRLVPGTAGASITSLRATQSPPAPRRIPALRPERAEIRSAHPDIPERSTAPAPEYRSANAYPAPGTAAGP